MKRTPQNRTTEFYPESISFLCFISLPIYYLFLSWKYFCISSWGTPDLSSPLCSHPTLWTRTWTFPLGNTWDVAQSVGHFLGMQEALFHPQHQVNWMSSWQSRGGRRVRYPKAILCYIVSLRPTRPTWSCLRKKHLGSVLLLLFNAQWIIFLLWCLNRTD